MNYINHKMNSIKIRRISKITLCLFFVLSFLFLSLPVSADEATVEKYAPFLYFESTERLYPIEAEYHIFNSDLYSFDGETARLVDDSPNSEKIGMIREEFFFLDNIHGDLRDSESIISHYEQNKDDYETVVYYRETSQSINTIIQYWFFYAYNKGELNVHEGDWEMVQIILQSDVPTKVMYSQHHSGQQTTWANVEKTSTHPHVYVARGSHANYLRSFSGKLGVASDIVGGNGKVLSSSDYTLVELSDQDWLSFEGKWGEIDSFEDAFLGFSGPPGPMFRANGQMWNNPIVWGENLPELNISLLPLEFILYHFLTIFIIITLISVGFIIYRLYKRKKDHGLGPRIFSFLYIDGLNQHSIANILFFGAIIIAIIGLLSPWYAVSGDVDMNEYSTDGTIDFLLIDGINGVQISYPGSNYPVAIGSFVLPFSLLIGIGFVFTILKTIGIKESKHLGKVFLRRGIGLITPFVILVIAIFALAAIISSAVPQSAGTNEITQVFTALADQPLAGSETISISESGVSGMINLQWGLELGGYLLLLAGIILICSYVLHKMDGVTFY